MSGLPLNIFGVPRSTVDIDFLVHRNDKKKWIRSWRHSVINVNKC